MEHSDFILKIMYDRGITAYRMAKETGITESLFSSWKKTPTSNIYSGNLVRIGVFRLFCGLSARAHGEPGNQPVGA